MDKGSQHSLMLTRLQHGGYVVKNGEIEPGMYRSEVFASSSIDEALQFMRDAILPVGGPEPSHQ